MTTVQVWLQMMSSVQIAIVQEPCLIMSVFLFTNHFLIQHVNFLNKLNSVHQIYKDDKVIV